MNRIRISPNGQLIAFTGEYDGNMDVYVVSVDGGDPKRLTWHPGVDMVTGWSNDGMKVVFTSGRKNAPYPDLDQLWEFLLKGAIQVLIYLELQTANSPQTDCSLYMNRFSGSMVQELQRRAK
jgi:Tol biopolymer transport system component